MRLSDAFDSRNARLLTLGTVAAVGLGATIAVWQSTGVIAGVAVGLLMLIVGALTETTIELSSKLRLAALLGEEQAARLSAVEQSQQDLVERVLDIDARITTVGDRVAQLQAELGELERDGATAEEKIARVEKATEILDKRFGRTFSDLKQVSAIQRHAVAGLRAEIGELGRRMIIPLTSREASRLAKTKVDDPMLSIAIPSFNRPDHLRRCLQSVVDEIEDHGLGDVEVHITDDASTSPNTLDVAREFAERHAYLGLHVNERNAGLERNLINAVEPCRGDYLLLLGNDDSFVPGAIKALINDLSREDCFVHIYEKTRVGPDGVSAAPPMSGTTPIEVAAGATHRFGSLIESAQGAGLLSTYGFISQVVVRRAEFAAVDATPYLGLTLYPQVGILCEAFAERSVCYHNVPLVHHRTLSSAEKVAEAIGRQEELLMDGGPEQRARSFGPSLGAFLQRIIERSTMTHEQLVTLPERLLTDGSLWDWIQENAALASKRNIEFAPEVLGDYEVFSDAMLAAGN